MANRFGDEKLKAELTAVLHQLQTILIERLTISELPSMNDRRTEEI